MGYYSISFIAAAAVFAVGILAAIRIRNSKGTIHIGPIKCLIMGTFTSSAILFLPIYYDLFRGEPKAGLKAVLISIHNAIRLFIVDGEFDIIEDNINRSLGQIAVPYSVFAAWLYVLAPFLTFGIVLSLIKNVYAYFSYTLSFFRDVYVFSELNQEAVELASDIKRNHPRSAIVFTDVFEKNEDGSYELMQRAKSVMGIFFKSDIEYIRFGLHSMNRKITFLMLGSDEKELIRQTMTLIRKYNGRKNTELFAFTSSSEGELILSDIDKGVMKVRRINENNVIINRYLYENGDELFDNAVQGEQDLKEINVMIVGFDDYGREMLKSLSWFCQMDGYRVCIDAYDKDADAFDRFAAECTELLDDEHNGVFDPDDAGYEIRMHPDINAGSVRFVDSVMGTERETTFVFVSLGADDDNVRTATRMRTLFERRSIHPQIVTVVRDSSMNKGLANIHNFDNDPYDIRFIGAMDDVFTERTIIASDLEMEALERHLKYGPEEDFWKYEYNYRSSIATAIHSKAKVHCGIPGADKKEEELTPYEREIIERLEHRRWNAYMRSEGFVFSGSTDKSSRSNLGKMHNNLVPYKSLSEEDKRKDSKVSSK